MTHPHGSFDPSSFEASAHVRARECHDSARCSVRDPADHRRRHDQLLLLPLTIARTGVTLPMQREAPSNFELKLASRRITRPELKLLACR